ncbi:Protein-lysine N-methyltransferase efm4 [Cladophialophora chaetospira]|uniref:Protein-lysine N-methyltransferase EFM4 n=1 Tax=Cladophialophora chaetospira TaxID=386627 RepID=A0AA39CL53_9EURO|nr:Protein-lysine N-methyltransferase efm4 [Cladophialophora chaetospira]
MPESRPTNLDPSELGTKEYWEQYYERDLNGGSEDGDVDENESDSHVGTDVVEDAPNPSDLESWFDDVGAPAKTLAFLTSSTFTLSPNITATTESEPARPKHAPAVLDLGTGNGSALFSLHLQGGYHGPMVGVDYSRKSIELADRLRHKYAAYYASSTRTALKNISFYVFDIIEDNPRAQAWWPYDTPNPGFDLVLDKGTFDAISLSSATSTDETGRERRICELYPSRVLDLVRLGGFLLLTSCNWTEAEVISWFTGASANAAQDGAAQNFRFEVFDTIKYPVFEFGGQKGQGVASVCFRKVGGE